MTLKVRQRNRDQKKALVQLAQMQFDSEAVHRRFRLAVLASHPIQYHVPVFRALSSSREIDLHVFYCSRIGAKKYLDPGFRVQLSWDIPLLDGYKFTFLRNLNPRPCVSPLGLINPGIVAHILSGSFDALLINGWTLATNWMGWGAATVRRIPVLLRCESNGLSEARGAKRLAKRLLLRLMFRPIRGFLAIGTNNRNFYLSCGVPRQRIFWTPYTVDNDFFYRQARRVEACKASLREREGIAIDRPLLLVCGKLIPVKGTIDVLRAVNILKEELSVSVAIVGDGPLRNELSQYVQDSHLSNVHFLGFRNQTEIGACYAMADVLVVPSNFEPWGLVVNEAMCFGLPIIASDRVGAVVDLIHDGENGLVYPVGDTAALSNCLRQVLGNETKRLEMGRRSREIVENWKIDRVVEGFLEAMRSVVRKSP